MGLSSGAIRKYISTGLIVLSLLPWASAANAGPGAASDGDGAIAAGGDNAEGRTGPYWIGASLVLLGGVAMLVDEPIRDFYQSHMRSKATDAIADVARNFGDGLVLTSLLGAGYVTGRILDDERASQASLTGLESFLAAGLLTEGIKHLARRDRPNHNDDPYAFHGPGAKGAGKSFISGHATHAFAVATSIALTYDDTPYVAPVAYGIASLTALSRINDDKHWTSDVVLGSAVGFLIAQLVHGLNRPRETQKSALSVSPRLDGDAAGLLVTIKF